MSTDTRITSAFGANSTAREVAAGHDLSGRRAIVTGAATGIGVETARALAEAGAEVTLAVRNLEASAGIAARARAIKVVITFRMNFVPPRIGAEHIPGWIHPQPS